MAKRIHNITLPEVREMVDVAKRFIRDDASIIELFGASAY